MNDSKLVPSFRFIEFKEGYTKNKLKEMASFLKGKGYSKNDIVNYGFPIILYGRMYTNYRLNIKFINDTFVKNDKNSVKSVEGDVIIPASGETAEDISKASNIKRSGIIIGGDINIIRPDNKLIDSSFLALVLSNGKVKQKIAKRAQGKSIVHIHNTDLMSLEIYFPSLDEQQKIGNLFTKLDKLLDLQQQKIDKLELLKKALLQTLFPRHDAQIPEFRFKGFEEDWKKTRIGKIVQYSNSTYSVKDLKQKKGKESYSVYDATGRQYYSNSFDMDKKYIAIIKDGSNVGAVKLLPARTSVLSTMGYLGAHNSDIVFDYYVFKKFNFKKYKVGSGIPHIYFSDYKIQVELVPQLSEQQKIGNLLSKVDQLIELENKKLQNFQQVKKCLLQNMFVD